MVSRRSPLFVRMFRLFHNAGFTVDESTWAAENGLSTREITVIAVIRSRRLFIKDHMEAFGSSRDTAIAVAATALKDRNRRRGLTGERLFNIYREISP